MSFAFLWERALKYRRELALISVLSLASSGALLVLPWLAGQFLGGVVGDAAIDLPRTLLLLAGALVGRTALDIAASLVSAHATGRILAGLRREVYEHIQLLPISYHERSRHGDLLALTTYEVGNLSRFLSSTLASLPATLVTAAGALIVLFLLDPVLALMAPLLVPVFYVVMKLIGRRLRGLAKRQREADVNLIVAAQNDLEMLPAIKAFASEDQRRMAYRDKAEEARRLQLKQAQITAVIGSCVTLLAAGAAIALLMIGGQQVAAGTRSPGEVFAFLFYAALLTRPVGMLIDVYGQWQIAKGTLGRMVEVMAVLPEQGYAATGEMTRARGAIAFEGIHFAYPGRQPVFANLDLSIAPGEVVALTGDNGIGKTTLIRLLLRYYDPTSGRITLDGTDISTIKVQDLRRQFGYVPQRPLLFNGTIADNIAFDTPVEDPHRLERAARAAQAWDFITNLPAGFATEIGDDGIRLSGGQQQRIALARALFHDPPIFIFDEATSMFDLDGEAAFVESCITELQDRTVIIITHRPASLALANRIIEVTPQGLITRPGGQQRQAS